MSSKKIYFKCSLADTSKSLLMSRVARDEYDDDDDDDDEYDEEYDDSDDINESEEYWLHDGSSTYANGDLNHEAIAEQHMMALLDAESALGMRDGDAGREDSDNKFYEWCEELDGFENTSRMSNYPEEFQEYVKKLIRKYRDKWVNHADLDDYLRLVYLGSSRNPAERKKLSKEFDAIIKGFSNPRLYVQQHHGWQAVRGRVIEVYTLDERAARNMARGLEDAYQNPTKQTFTIEVYHPIQKTLWNIRFEDIENGAVVNMYRRAIAPELKRQKEDALKLKVPAVPIVQPPVPVQTNQFDRPGATSIPDGLSALYAPDEQAKNVRDQMHGVPGYKSPQYDRNQINAPKRYDGTPVYKYPGASVTHLTQRLASIATSLDSVDVQASNVVDWVMSKIRAKYS